MCPTWWRSQLKRAAVRTHEAKAIRSGAVSRKAGQVYCTDETLRNRAIQNESNRKILERTELESADGEVISLLRAVESSVANKAIRRGELMTRIRGAEEWAEHCGMVGLFVSPTAPSRYHSQGGANPKYDGSTPRDAQRWLCLTWSRARAALRRGGVRMFGYRVAEPHKDGCPHWHMLLWCEPAKLQALQNTMRKYWLTDDGDERGAHDHRITFKALEQGGAIAYVAKYISKGIDDAGAVATEGHLDDYADEQGEMFDGTAKRVEAWAAAWGIRQFQALGQPPVTVWRELRRVDALAAQGASDAIKAAHRAVNRDGERRACFRAYLDAQGGAMTGRGYRLRIEADEKERIGRYGPTDVRRPVGVVDVQRPGEVVLSNRKEWRPRGTWTTDCREDARIGLAGAVRDWLFARPKAAQPWTRVINCTQRPRPQELMKAGIVGAWLEKMEPGGSTSKENHHGSRQQPPDYRTDHGRTQRNSARSA